MGGYYGYNQQMNYEKLKRTRDEIDNLLNSVPQPVIQQNFMQPVFQSDFDAKWIDNKNELNNIVVNRDAIFMDKNNPIFYLKDAEGNIKAYDFTEHIEIDERDVEINNLKKRIEELERKEKANGKSVIQDKPKQSVDNDKQIQ